MGNSKIPAYGGGCCGSVGVPVARVVSAPTGVVDYANIINKPRIEDVELIGNVKLEELGFSLATDEQIDSLFGLFE